MNAIMALLTAASVLAHAALGCCFNHSHGPATNVASRPLPTHEHHHGRHAHSGPHDHQHSGPDEQVPQSPPHRHCDEGFCSAVSGAAPVTLYKATQAAFDLPASDMCLDYGRPSVQTDYSRLQHDLGPPLRPHLCNLVLLI